MLLIILHLILYNYWLSYTFMINCSIALKDRKKNILQDIAHTIGSDGPDCIKDCLISSVFNEDL